MKKYVLLILAALAFQAPALAQRVQSQAELDALLAPVALQQDAVLWQILEAATHPEEVTAAADWSRANPGLSGEAAVSAVRDQPWHPDVKGLAAFPDLLQRMAESPQWLADLGAAFRLQQAQVLDTVQALRSRAHATGYLRSDESRVVEYETGSYAVVPSRPHVVYVSYYDPFVVYGPWWWHAHRPVFWRPWTPRAVVVGPAFYGHRHPGVRPDWRHRHVRPLPPQRRPHAHPPAALAQPAAPFVHPSPGVHRIPESQRRPILQSTPLQPPPAMRTAPHPSRHSHTPAPQQQPRAFKQRGSSR